MPSNRPSSRPVAGSSHHTGEPASVPFGPALATELAERRRAVLAAALVTVLGVIVLVGTRTSSSPAAAVTPIEPATRPVPRAPEAPATPEQQYAVLADHAAATCPGLPSGVLYAIAETETRHGRDAGVSTAGAAGPMQFLPATWRAYATDGNRDGRLEIENPADAVHTAARHLCANGGADPGLLRDAIWNYNHSSAYVEQVLRIARTYTGRF